MDALILQPEKRVFSYTEESYTFLVECCGYEWKDLQMLKIMSKRLCNSKLEKIRAKKELETELKRLCKSNQ